jgi:hypothetical protein
MSAQWIPAGLRAEVRHRARGRCEYCVVHEDDVGAPHEPDHIIAEQHGGQTTAENLAYACYHCNRYKGANLASVDPESGQPVFLFQPRRDTWADHFRIEGAIIVGLTAVGRTTSALLRFNTPERLESRRLLVLAQRYPCS